MRAPDLIKGCKLPCSCWELNSRTRGNTFTNETK